MDPTQLAELLTSFKTIADSNKQLMAQLQANATAATEATGAGPGAGATTAPTNNSTRDSAANVALTSIKVPLDMGDNAEEQLVNFHE